MYLLPEVAKAYTCVKMIRDDTESTIASDHFAASDDALIFLDMYDLIMMKTKTDDNCQFQKATEIEGRIELDQDEEDDKVKAWKNLMKERTSSIHQGINTSLNKSVVNKKLDQFIKETMMVDAEDVLDQNEVEVQNQDHLIYSNRELAKLYVSTGRRIKTFNLNTLATLNDKY